LHTPNGLVTDNIKKAEALNAQFKSVFTIEPNQPLPDKGLSPYPIMSDIIRTVTRIVNLLQNLDVHKATGPDEISARVLKELSDVLSPTLKIIFDYSLDTSTVLKNWKEVNVTFIFKKGDHSQPNNYRSISLTNIVSKIFEHILSSSIMKHLETNNIIHYHQHGFRCNHSCETQLISVQDLIFNYNKNIQTDLISMDFAKAFDTVSHLRLLYKLQ